MLKVLSHNSLTVIISCYDLAEGTLTELNLQKFNIEMMLWLSFSLLLKSLLCTTAAPFQEFTFHVFNSIQLWVNLAMHKFVLVLFVLSLLTYIIS